MPDVFEEYQPNASHKRSGLRACAECYSRKVKCSIDDGGLPCQRCIRTGIDCRLRTRKRKAASLDGDDGLNVPLRRPRAHSFVEGPNAPDDRQSTASLLAGRDHIEAPFLFVDRVPNEFSPTASATSSSVDRFRNSSFLSRSVILGDEFPGIDHSHVDRALTESRLSDVDGELLRVHNAFKLPDLPTRQSLFEAFVERCWTWMPVIDLESIHLRLNGEGSSLLLVQAVMLVGALMRPSVYSRDEIQAYYLRVKSLIQSGHEKDPLNILSALCLIQWYTPAAPKDISTDTPRFWNTYAIGLAQQMGLHRAQSKEPGTSKVRRRIWFTLCARDNLTSAAHGRPRLLDPADSNVPSLTLDDFSPSDERRASIFTAYSTAMAILGDLCQILTRSGHASCEQASSIASRLQKLLSNLPTSLWLRHEYDVDVAQLHLHVLAIVAILHRPRSVFSLSAGNATSVTAASIMFRIFQSIELREQTRYLSSAFAWHLLVAAIPLLSCLGRPALKMDAQHSLDSLETTLRTLGTVRPAAANNLKSVQAIRKALNVTCGALGSVTQHDQQAVQPATEHTVSPVQLLSTYDPSFVEYYHKVMSVLKPMINVPTTGALDFLTYDNEIAAPAARDSEPFLNLLTHTDGSTNPLADFLQDDLLTNNFWMRDWMDELASS